MGSNPVLVLQGTSPHAGVVAQLVAALSGQLVPLLGRQVLLIVYPYFQQLVKGAGCWVPHVLCDLKCSAACAHSAVLWDDSDKAGCACGQPTLPTADQRGCAPSCWKWGP